MSVLLMLAEGGRGYTFREIAGRLQCSSKTARRWIDALERAGVPVIFESEPLEDNHSRTRVRIDRRWVLNRRWIGTD